ncbi:MAG: DNA polymerase III subunit alpha [Cyclobacteriaceae bacterium]|nr:DNA polymerase III subunit alpha [Cyclobacteriaceae bacterium]
MYLIFDTETTGLPKNKQAPLDEFDNWPRVVQIAWQLHDNKGKLLSNENLIVKPDGFTIPFNAEKVHGISTQRAMDEGVPLAEVLERFSQDMHRADRIIGHNIVDFDIKIVGCEYLRSGMSNLIASKEPVDTQLVATEFCAIPGGRGGQFKWPTLIELHHKLFGEGFGDAHDAAYDVAANARCFFGLLTHKVVRPADDTVPTAIVYEAPDLAEANFAKQKKSNVKFTDSAKVLREVTTPFCHLHMHSQFSVLQATPNIKSIIKKAKEYEMPAVALTDLGNMFGAFKFVREALANDIKPILGCEFFVAEERQKLKFTKDNPDKRFNQVLLAKNKQGYLNLAKLSSYGYTEGLYGLYPRIDKELIAHYAGHTIALSGGLSGELPSLILNVGEHQAEDALKWWLRVFGEDFYIELLRHGLEENNRVNEVLLRFAAKYDVKVIASNDVYYLNQADANAHDVLICVKENELQSTPIGRGRGFRYGFPNQEYYFKTQKEMKDLFADIPEAIENINELVDKIEKYQLDREVLLPAFGIPEGFETEDDYLRHLTYEGAKRRYPEITPEIRDRLDFELETIKNTGYPGYFLIVQDFTSEARRIGVSVGPGRGSAAGSAVAYCIGITNVDPIAYDLLFERFLNPDRVSLPDIDIDFDDEGRGKIIDYVVKKYGRNQVAQIITYGTMAAKSSIKDAARVMELPLPSANALAKLVPERPGTTLEKAFKEVPELEEIGQARTKEGEVLRQARILEGSVRNTGIHACGVIITPDDITKFIPVSVSKDSDLYVTQFDNSVVENAGMLKMDFLGLKTLSVIKTALEYIEKGHGVIIDIDAIPLDDAKTFELYQKGHTNGTFQFESAGMQKHLRALKPDKFEDLIAMNALYRPGPMEYIPNFIKRKHGEEEITYDIAAMEEYLAETYGITVYQEQVMLLSQKLANFSKGDADVLRKAMGKKILALLEKLKPKFLDGCKTNGHDVAVAEKVWKDWEAFAAYAFNKSHSTCYSIVAYQTAYLKAHYPAEFMASVLTHNQSQIDKVTFFMEECRHQGIKVLGPSINESGLNFEVNKAGEIRFGLGAIKGAGEAAVQAIIQEREKGPFEDIFDFATRVNLRAVNKKTFECMAMSGAFDCFENHHRRQFLFEPDNDMNLIEKAIRYGNKEQSEKNAAQQSLFGGDSGLAVPVPRVPDCEPYGELEKLKIEKEVVGFYISGHPLDQFKFEIISFAKNKFADLQEMDNRIGSELSLAGIVTEVAHKVTKNGKPFGIMTIEGYEDSHTFYLFSDDYIRFKEFMVTGWFLYLKGVVTTKPWGDQRPEFKINSMQLLSEIRDKLSKTVQVHVKPISISSQLIDRIEAIISQHPGKCAFKLNLVEESENISVDLMSRKYLVSPKDELLKALEDIPEIQCQVST